MVTYQKLSLPKSIYSRVELLKRESPNGHNSFLLDFLENSGSIPAFKRHADDLPALDTEGYRHSFEFGDRKCRLVYGDESEVVPAGRTTGEASVSHRKLHFEVFRLIS